MEQKNKLYGIQYVCLLHTSTATFPGWKDILLSEEKNSLSAWWVDRAPCTNSSHSNSSPESLSPSFQRNTNGPHDRPIPSMSGIAAGEVWLSRLRNCNCAAKTHKSQHSVLAEWNWSMPHIRLHANPNICERFTLNILNISPSLSSQTCLSPWEMGMISAQETNMCKGTTH